MSGESLHTVSVERHQITTNTISLSSNAPSTKERIILKSPELSVPRQKTTGFTVCFDKTNVYYFNNNFKTFHTIPVLPPSLNREILDCYLSSCSRLLWVQFKRTESQQIHFFSLILSIPSKSLLCTFISKNKDQYNNTIRISNNSKHITVIENGNFNIYKIPQQMFKASTENTKYLINADMFKTSRSSHVNYFDDKWRCNSIKKGSFFKFEVVNNINNNNNNNNKEEEDYYITIYEDYNYKFDLNKVTEIHNNNNINNNKEIKDKDNINNNNNSTENKGDLLNRRNKAFDEYKEKIQTDFEPKRKPTKVRSNSNSKSSSKSSSEENFNENNNNKEKIGGTIYYYKFSPSTNTLSLIHTSTNPLVCKANSDYFKHLIFTISSSANALIKFILFTQTCKTLSKSLKYYDSTSADLYLLSNNEITHCLEISEFISLTAATKSFVIVYGILPNTQTNVYNLTKTQRFKKETLNVTEVSDCFLSNCNKVACFFGSGNLGGKLKFYEYGKEKKELGESKHIGTRKLQWSVYNSNYILTAALYPYRRVDNGINVWRYNGEHLVFLEKKNLLDCSFIGPVEVDKIGKVEMKRENNKKMSLVPGLDALNKFLK
eukprot:GAHX01001401.1.p1 GENE.GAHX01001401.1~~GAHX01001401.1.p1  ORF type:complete len:617 (+),score=144.34 GAHX01001401.1:41-1852(+)